MPKEALAPYIPLPTGVDIPQPRNPERWLGKKAMKQA